MLEERFVHILPSEHLFVELDQEILSLLATHPLNLRLKGADAELLL